MIAFSSKCRPTSSSDVQDNATSPSVRVESQYVFPLCLLNIICIQRDYLFYNRKAEVSHELRTGNSLEKFPSWNTEKYALESC